MSEFIDLMEDEDQLRARLDELRRDHQSLDDDIDGLGRDGKPVDFLLLQRLKKRKLALKDMISRLESLLLPDIIA